MSLKLASACHRKEYGITFLLSSSWSGMITKLSFLVHHPHTPTHPPLPFLLILNKEELAALENTTGRYLNGDSHYLVATGI